jgi:hypothetical protein
MGGPFTYVRFQDSSYGSQKLMIQLTHPIQNIRYYRGKLHNFLPSWLPLREWIVNRRYEVYMCSPSTEQFSTIPEFYSAAENVVIDSTYSFNVSSPTDKGSNWQTTD